MNFIKFLKKWFTFYRTPKGTRKTIGIQNGREAFIDEHGNFLGFKK